MRTSKLIIDNTIVDSVNDRWAASNTDRMVSKIWPGLYEGRTMSLIKLQRCALSVVVGFITGHCIMGRYVRRIGLVRFANDFRRRCKDD